MNPANALTLLSAGSGIGGLLALVAGGPRAVPAAITCVAASLLLDRLDGWVARRLGLASELGARLDTLADLLAFGALPAALLVARHPDVPSALVAVGYALAAVWRLARYEDGELAMGRFGPSFFGVPSPVAAAAVVAAVVLPVARADLAVAVAAAASMPSSLRYPKYGVGLWPWLVIVPATVIAGWWRA
jgi:CDP-diacylglycerol--serine O-phosphatidyltransferase